jgi:hypothetical protein
VRLGSVLQLRADPRVKPGDDELRVRPNKNPSPGFRGERG